MELKYIKLRLLQLPVNLGGQKLSAFYIFSSFYYLIFIFFPRTTQTPSSLFRPSLPPTAAGEFPPAQ